MPVSTGAKRVGSKYGTGSLKSLSIGATTLSTAIAGQAFDLGACRSAFSVQVVGMTTGSSVALQGSLDGTNWTTLGSAFTSTADGVARSTASTPVQFVRLRATTLTTHASRSVSGYIGVL